MYIYNVTIQVNLAIHELWVEWMKQKHIPEVMATGCFVKHQLVRILDIDETEAVTYAAQYYVKTLEDYKRYIEEYAETLRMDALQTWGSDFIGFRSLMQVVD